MPRGPLLRRATAALALAASFASLVFLAPPASAKPGASPTPTPSTEAPTTGTPTTPAAATGVPSTPAPDPTTASAPGTAPGTPTSSPSPTPSDPNLAKWGARMGQSAADTGAAAAAPVNKAAVAAPSTWMPAGVQGLDVYGGTYPVDWAAQFAMGARFAYVKATEGMTYKNNYFAAEYNGSYAAGMVRGAYHYALPPAGSGTAQAQFFWNNGGKWSADGKTLPPALDIEYNPYPATYGDTCYNMTQAEMTSWIRDFVTTLSALIGRKITIYTTANWWATCVGSTSFGDQALWVARYSTGGVGALPAGWSTYRFWQYSSTGPFAGDSDVWNGTYDDLVTFAKNGSTSVPPGTALPAQLVAGATVKSPNGLYTLVMQGDGNLVTYDSSGRATWASATFSGRGMTLQWQGDGNLVLYDAQGPRWATMTNAAGGKLQLENDGNLTLRTSSGTLQWDSRGTITHPVTRFTPTVVPGRGPGEYVSSLNGRFRLVMQGDGNLVEYGPHGVVWASGTDNHPGAWLAVQGDGNVVVYSSGGVALWSSGTAGTPGAALWLNEDGTLVLRSASGVPVWDAAGTIPRLASVPSLGTGGSVASPGGGAFVAMQTDGNLVVYVAGQAVWSSGTAGNTGAWMAVQGDGNVVVYCGSNQPLWYSGTAGYPGARLTLSDAGILAIYDTSGVARWTT